jgi:hypothetical protein
MYIFLKIPPGLPLPKGGIPLFGKACPERGRREGSGEILRFHVNSILRPLKGIWLSAKHVKSS